MLVDTHAHLNFPQFSKDRKEVIRKAKEAGVTQIVNVGTNLDISNQAVLLADRFDGVYAAVGIHPHDVEAADEGQLEALSSLLALEKVVAVGETGLDFFRDYAPHDLQEQVFRKHIRMGVRAGLPLMVHSRGAEARTLEMLEAESAYEVGGLLHCFGGTIEQAMRGADLNFGLGFGGTVTFRKSSSLSVALQIPPDHLVLETDCPYLAPVPKRGKRNEPAYVRYVAEFLAREGNEPIENLSARTTENAQRFLALPNR